MWDNYLLFVMLTGSDDDIRDAFDISLAMIKPAEQRQELWLKYLQFKRSRGVLESELIETADKMLAEVSPVVETPLLIEEKSHKFCDDIRVQKLLKQRKKKVCSC
jgi:hypothetical protein